MKRPFFDVTCEALDAITSLFDFVWPTATAIWNLRWQVAGYYEARPFASVEELQARFVEGSGIHGANLKRACIDTPWEQQTAILGALLLTNLFAVYEGWAKCLVAYIGKSESYAKKFHLNGLQANLSLLQQPTSKFLKQTIYLVLTNRSFYSLNYIDNYASMYRYFKEIRNKQIHNHGIADQVCETSYKKFAAIANPTALGISVVPEHFPVSVGQPVKVSLRGVVGFSDILRRMLYTIDAELSCAQAAELMLDVLWARARPTPSPFKADKIARYRQIARTFAKMGFSGVHVSDDIENVLIARNLVSFVPKGEAQHRLRSDSGFAAEGRRRLARNGA